MVSCTQSLPFGAWLPQRAFDSLYASAFCSACDATLTWRAAEERLQLPDARAPHLCIPKKTDEAIAAVPNVLLRCPKWLFGR